MSMTGEIDARVFSALAKKIYGKGTLTLAEETAIGEVLGFGQSGSETGGLPSSSGGDVEGWNSLSRTNWFNGRYLTAEALRRQDSYFDQRTRLAAHLLEPGVAYGLGLEADALNAAPYGEVPSGGFPADRAITLTPGLAFDMIGRPIVVPQDFRFTLADLVSLRRRQPRRVLPGGTQFAPCVCLAPEPEGPQGGGPAIRPGPYLLVIEAAEKAAGTAKVYGDVCGGATPTTCEADHWTAGFGLSLVRFPVEVPESEDVSTAWDLRGILSAYYFDVFEHSLIRRWDPPFATDHRFCAGTDPWRHDNGAVALAMVYLADEHTARFIDPWIPRRSIVGSPGEESHRTRFGAPPRSAAWARISQFQCMLAESLDAAPLAQQGELRNRNLLRRGFRHIPPIGFLPIDPALAGQEQGLTGIANIDKLFQHSGLQLGLLSGQVRAAVRQAQSYFQGTNVLAYATVALHDDDILEDLGNVFDKDPVQLAPQPGDPISEKLWPRSGDESLPRMARMLQVILRLGAGELINRTIEVVKLVVPLQGLRRRHPILGVVPEDAADQLSDWGIEAGNLAFTLDSQNMAGLRIRAALSALPRHFVVYVKQRLVLLDVILLAWELFGLASKVATTTTTTTTTTDTTTAPSVMPKMMTVSERRAAVQAQPAESSGLATALLSYPAFTATLRQALPLVAPAMASPERARSFAAAVERQDKALAATIPDAALRRQAAVDKVTDSYAASFPDFEVLQALAAVQPADQTEALMKSIAAAPVPLATTMPAAGATVADRLAPPPVFASETGAKIFAELHAATAETTVAALDKELARKVPADLTVADLLAKPPAQAEADMGKAAYEAASAAIKARLAQNADAAEALAKPAPSAAATKVLADALDKAKDPAAAIAAARKTAGTSAPVARYLDHAETVAKTLGTANPALIRSIIAGRL